MAKHTHMTLDEVIVHFAELDERRSEIDLKHPLISVVVIAIMRVLAGASGPTCIAIWANSKKNFLLDLLPLPNSIPQKDATRRVLSALKPEAFQSCFASCLEALKEKAAEVSGIERPVFAVDGKTLRGSHNRKPGLGALHSVSVLASEFGLSLGQVATDEKSNEITAIPDLLRLVDLNGAIITIDAMGA